MSNNVKHLEARIKGLEKVNEMPRLKSIAWETLVDIDEKQFDISVKKKSAPKPLKR
jgi:hypothetical protein